LDDARLDDTVVPYWGGLAQTFCIIADAIPVDHLAADRR
jgi:hypothetical protein